jgi:hypothetical protein
MLLIIKYCSCKFWEGFQITLKLQEITFLYYWHIFYDKQLIISHSQIGAAIVLTKNIWSRHFLCCPSWMYSIMLFDTVDTGLNPAWGSCILLRVFINVKCPIFKDYYSCLCSDCIALFRQFLDVYYALLFRKNI